MLLFQIGGRKHPIPQRFFFFQRFFLLVRCKHLVCCFFNAGNVKLVFLIYTFVYEYIYIYIYIYIRMWCNIGTPI